LYTADASAIATMMGHTCAGLLGLFALDSRHRPNSKLTKLSALTAPIWFINFSMFNFSDFFENTMTALAREASPDCTYLIPLAWLANLFSISAT
jgi:hypothetical protein